MELDVTIEVLESSSEVLESSSGVLPATGDGLWWPLVALVSLFLAAVVFLVRQRFFAPAYAHSIHKAKTGTHTLFSLFFALTLSALLLGTGGILTGFAANTAADNTLKMTITKGQTGTFQSTVALPLTLDTSVPHGSSVFLSCVSNDLDKSGFVSTLAAPSVLPADAVGFALVANPSSTAKNTVTNGFSAAYASVQNVTNDAHLFAALPAFAGLPATPGTLIFQSGDATTSLTTLYLSAKASSALTAGTYHVRLKIDLYENALISFDANGGSGSFDTLISTGVENTVPAAPAGFLYPGHDFVSWNDKADGTGTTFLPGEMAEFSGDTTLYAVWEPATYEVSFDVGYPTGTVPPPITVTFGLTYGEGISGGLPPVSQIGHIFKGWYDAPSGGNLITDATVVAITEDHTLYARWEQTLSFTVEVTAGNLDFTIPTNGYSAAGLGAPYSWVIDWGDGSPPEPVAGTSTPNVAATGIPHTYPATGTYTIIISPQDTSAPFEWARAFGASSFDFSQSASLDKIRTVVSMPARGFLASETSTGDYFLYATWLGCRYLTIAAVPDTSGWQVESIGDNFLAYTWYYCENLEVAVVPDTSGWQVNTIGDNFLDTTWMSCHSLETAVVPDTSGWTPGSIGDYFLAYTWFECNNLTTAAVPDTASWAPDSIGDNFLASTWANCYSLETALVPDTLGWPVENIGNEFLVGTWSECISIKDAVVPDTSGWQVDAIGDFFLNATWVYCENLETAAVPNTKNWTPNSIGDYFLYYTWADCYSLTTAVAPDTESWQVESIGDGFLYSTWEYCDNLTTAAVPKTAGWQVESIGDYFLYFAWAGCTSLETAVVPNTASWTPDSIGDYFLDSTWIDCDSLTTAVVPDTSNWDVSNIGGNFLAFTWAYCPSLKDISNLRFSNSFRRAAVDTSNYNWFMTFYLYDDESTTPYAQPSFYDGKLITAAPPDGLGIPSDNLSTFAGRVNMDGYYGLDVHWRQ
jgi:hypothetical protein